MNTLEAVLVATIVFMAVERWFRERNVQGELKARDALLENIQSFLTQQVLKVSQAMTDTRRQEHVEIMAHYKDLLNKSQGQFDDVWGWVMGEGMERIIQARATRRQQDVTETMASRQTPESITVIGDMPDISEEEMDIPETMDHEGGIPPHMVAPEKVLK
jgi:hypothetical protein